MGERSCHRVSRTCSTLPWTALGVALGYEARQIAFCAIDVKAAYGGLGRVLLRASFVCRQLFEVVERHVIRLPNLSHGQMHALHFHGASLSRCHLSVPQSRTSHPWLARKPLLTGVSQMFPLLSARAVADKA